MHPLIFLEFKLPNLGGSGRPVRLNPSSIVNLGYELAARVVVFARSHSMNVWCGVFGAAIDIDPAFAFLSQRPVRIRSPEMIPTRPEERHVGQAVRRETWREDDAIE